MRSPRVAGPRPHTRYIGTVAHESVPGGPTVALLTALLGGSILPNVFKEEIPSGRRTTFGWFLTGLVLYTGLLAAVTAVSE
jgi:hypothetical protein